jgi:tRNA(Ile)-lysidine synthase
MTRFEKKLRAELRRLKIGENARVLVAVSGGADSMALLHALARLRDCHKMPEVIVAAHLNHLLRGEESDGDESFVRNCTQQLRVPLCCEQIDVGKIAQAAGRNLEAVAREMRYEFLERAAVPPGAEVIVTAHTHDDQVETVLMRLLRGTSAAGLRGIQPTMELASGRRLVRPLLNFSRADVIHYCEHYQLAFRTDSSNLSDEFTRNRIRHELRPLLQSFNPHFEKALLRLTAQLTEDDDDLNAAAAEIFSSLHHHAETDSLDVKPLRCLTTAKRRRVLRLWLRERRGDLKRIDAVHLRAIEKLVMNDVGGKYVELPAGWQVWRKKEKIIILNDITRANTIH